MIWDENEIWLQNQTMMQSKKGASQSGKIKKRQKES